jgi:hypothetical protein
MRLLAIVFVVMLTMAAGAQEEKPSVPASQEDIRSLQEEIGRLRSEALVIERKSVARSKTEQAERQKLIDANKAEIASMEDKLAREIEAFSRESAIANEKRAQAESKERHFFLILWGELALCACVVLALVLFLVLRSSKKQKILIDPTAPEVKDFSLRNGNLNPVPAVFSLRNGKKFRCTVELRPGLDPLVHIEGVEHGVAWGKRRQVMESMMNESITPGLKIVDSSRQ